MASLRTVLQSRTLSSIPSAFRRSLTVNHPLKSSGTYMPRLTGYDASNPIPLEKVEPDHVLAAKEQGPWTELSKEEKVALYRSQFAKTLEEDSMKVKDGGLVFFGVGALFAIGTIFFVFLKKFVGPTAPYTFTPEWRAAQEEKMKLYRMNPITGISSKK